MSAMVQRRTLITLLGGAAAWPLVAHGQQAAKPVIGFLHPDSASTYKLQLGGLHKGLKEGGFVDGQNLTIEYRWAEGHAERLPEMAIDLVRRNVAAIVTAGGTVPTVVAKGLTTTIPIVFATGSDPIRLGLVASLAHPGGNLTGVSFVSADLTAKTLGLLNQIAPKARTIALLFNPTVPDSARQPAEAQEAAHALGFDLLVLNASTDAEIEQAFAKIPERGVGALLIGSDPFFGSRIGQLAALTQRQRLPAAYSRRQFCNAGGLMSYGTSIEEAFRQVGLYVTRILKGDKPADLPVMLPTKFEFVINLKTAKALGLTVPPGVSAMADEIIE
jgi:putative ABC transport system substrate-binding protein